ncbi:hypothetical protein Ahy_B09g098909 isoform A [Arachis hypogaea]|uniref:Uncharacterized protein n=1 Tax=Arachis hypogaea TaxID=3818 RepID=A0A444XSJ0_ARAHY|nr:hypothetical protein Ahy_B09g098909 isoform A [Arachis hypogaea]
MVSPTAAAVRGAQAPVCPRFFSSSSFNNRSVTARRQWSSSSSSSWSKSRTVQSLSVVQPLSNSSTRLLFLKTC